MLLENFMIALFCCAVGIRLVHHIRKKSFADSGERFTLITFGIGFILGAIWHNHSGNTWTAVFFSAGAYLAYVTLVFSWPTKTSVQCTEATEHD